MVAADGAVVDDDVPGPESDCVPLLKEISLLVLMLIQLLVAMKNEEHRGIPS